MGTSEENAIQGGVQAVFDDLKGRRRDLERQIQEGRERIEEWTIELTAIEQALSGLAASYGSTFGVEWSHKRPAIGKGQFANQTLAQGATAYLKLLGEPARTAAIWDALVKGGITSASQNPINNLGTTLSSKPDIFERTEEGWTLVAWKQPKEAKASGGQ